MISHLARLALYPLSVLSTCAGLALAGVAAMTSAVPMWVAGPGMAIAVHGLYTLLWLGSRFPLRKESADLPFAIGETVALVVGATGVVAAAISQTGASDPEYGPPTMLVLVAIHGLMGLLASARRSPERAVV